MEITVDIMLYRLTVPPTSAMSFKNGVALYPADIFNSL